MVGRARRHRPDDLRRRVALGWRAIAAPHIEQRRPYLMALGTLEQKQRILPGIIRGEVHFSIGYTEPSAGTDLASLKTRAVRDGDEYVINGQKIFTSAIQYADYVWLAARTDPDAPKHKGLSVFIVPVDTPGFRWTPLATIAGDITSSTFYEDVRVPSENLVGAENQGWKLITNQLNLNAWRFVQPQVCCAAWPKCDVGPRNTNWQMAAVSSITSGSK